MFWRNLSEIFADDKSQVILALTVIAILAMFKLDIPESIVSNIVAGLLGIAIGKVGK